MGLQAPIELKLFGDPILANCHHFGPWSLEKVDFFSSYYESLNHPIEETVSRIHARAAPVWQFPMLRGHIPGGSSW